MSDEDRYKPTFAAGQFAAAMAESGVAKAFFWLHCRKFYQSVSYMVIERPVRGGTCTGFDEPDTMLP